MRGQRACRYPHRRGRHEDANSLILSARMVSAISADQVSPILLIIAEIMRFRRQIRRTWDIKAQKIINGGQLLEEWRRFTCSRKSPLSGSRRRARYDPRPPFRR